MELRHLKYFSTLAEELHFGRAAEKLFIAQPPLSRQIKLLENELGVLLFTRDNKKVRLTEFGKYLKTECDKLFSDVDGILNNMKLLKAGNTGTITIGYVGAVMHSFLPLVLRDIVKKFPDITTLLKELDNDNQMKELKNNNIDIGFLRTPVVSEEITMESIYTETLSIIISNDHKLAAKKKIALSDLAEEPFIGFTAKCAPGLRNSIVSICGRAGFVPRITHETSQINTILRLVESNLGYSIIPTSVKTGYRLNLRFVELNKDPERTEICMAYNSAKITPITANVIQLIHSFPFKKQITQ